MKNFGKFLLCTAAIALFLLLGDGGLCLFRRITGWPCPGCGMTRAVVSALHGNFRMAFAYHPLWVFLPLFAWMFLTSFLPDLFPFVKKPGYQKVEQITAVILLVLVLGVYILRLLAGWDGIHLPDFSPLFA